MKIYIVLLFLFLLTSCQDLPNKKKHVKKGLVTLIIKNNNQVKTNIGSGINKNFDRVNINTNKITDTITLETNSYLKLYIKNNNFFNSVLCKKTDTLLINIKKTSTSLFFINRELKRYDSIPLNNLYKNNLKHIILKHNKLFKKFIQVNKSSNKFIPKKNIIKSNRNSFRELDSLEYNKLRIKKKVLNKLYKNNLISNINHVYHTSQVDFNYFRSLIRSYKFSLDNFYLKKIMNLYFNSELIFNDPFISYGYMNIFITDIVLIEDNSKINIDYQKAYKLLPSLLKGENLKLFREFCLHQIAKSDNNLANYYFNKYKDSYNDTLFIKVYANKYLINEKRKALASNKVELVDSDSKNITLDEVIKNYKDKTIYIDFWASWCNPCRNEMSKSKTLINEFKNVVFIYISIDSDKNEWMNASEEEKIEKNNNFLAINYPSSSFYKKLELQTIPRYLIYSKGKLVNENAPRPSSEKTKKLLNFYLN